MKIKISKVLSLSLVAMLASAMFVGCSGDSGDTTTTETTTPEVVVPETPPVDATPDMGVDGDMDFAMPEAGPLGEVAMAMMETMFGEGAGGSLMHSSDAAFIKDMFNIELSDDVVANFVLSQPMMNVQYQTFFAIQAQEGQVAEAEAILTKYREDEIVRVGPPDPYAHVDSRYLKAQAAQIVTIGDTVYFIAMGDVSALGDEPSLDEVKGAVQIAVDLLTETVEGGADAVVAPEVDMSALPAVSDMMAEGGAAVGDMSAPADGQEHLGEPIPEFAPEQHG